MLTQPQICFVQYSFLLDCSSNKYQVWWLDIHSCWSQESDYGNVYLLTWRPISFMLLICICVNLWNLQLPWLHISQLKDECMTCDTSQPAKSFILLGTMNWYLFPFEDGKDKTLTGMNELCLIIKLVYWKVVLLNLLRPIRHMAVGSAVAFD